MLNTKDWEAKANDREFERLKSLYPLFEVTRNGDSLYFAESRTSGQHAHLEHGRIDNATEINLDREHMNKSMSQELMTLYPDLFIHVFAMRDGCQAHVWIARLTDDGYKTDAESMGEINILNMALHKTLKKWQREAEKAKQDGWFFCSGHKKAEQKQDGDYFWFAGSFCKQYGIEHPDHLRGASSQNYE